MDPYNSTPHCPVCAAPLRPPIRACPACGAQHHAECWKYIGGCAIYACTKRALPPPLETVRPADLKRQRVPTQFSLISLLAFVAVLAVLASLIPFAYTDARQHSKVHDCHNNLKQIGLYLQTYVSRYGNDSAYPACRLPSGVDRTLAAGGTNGAFWSHLWLLPNPRECVSKRPGDNGLYQCKVYRGALTGTCLDYSGPNFANTSAFPGGILSDRVQADVYIAGDLLLPGDSNHGNDADGPTYDFNGLRFDGTVQNIAPSRPLDPNSEHGKYVNTTDAETGVRTR